MSPDPKKYLIWFNKNKRNWKKGFMIEDRRDLRRGGYVFDSVCVHVLLLVNTIAQKVSNEFCGNFVKWRVGSL